MKIQISKMIFATIFGIGVIHGFVNEVKGQIRPPRERRVERAQPQERPDKWSKGQRKEIFKKSVEGKTTERKLTERETASKPERAINKADKWRKNQIKDKFNKVANPPSPPSNPGGGRTGGAAAPPAVPAPRPPRPR